LSCSSSLREEVRRRDTSSDGAFRIPHPNPLPKGEGVKPLYADAEIVVFPHWEKARKGVILKKSSSLEIDAKP
jgi:hypothetical protein